MNPYKKLVVEKALSSGKIATITFIKKDGSERTINCKKFVRKGISDPNNPKVSTVSHIDKYMPVFDLQKNGYRNVNLETVLAVNDIIFIEE